MGDKFLGSGGTNINLSNGTAPIFGASIGAINLDPSQPLKTNSVRQLVSSKLDINDINNLQNELNNAIRDPITLKNKIAPATPAINTKVIYASSADNEIHLLDEFGVDKIFSTSTTPYLPLGGGTMTGDIDMSNNLILNVDNAGGLGLDVQNNKDNILTLQTDLGTETTNRTSEDINLQNQITTNDTDILNLQNDKVNKGGEPTGILSIGTQAFNTSGVEIAENGAPILQCGTTTGGDIEIRRTLKFTPFPSGTSRFYAFADDVAAGDSALQTQITNNLNQINTNLGDINTLQEDTLTLTPQKIDITQTFTDTTKWDAANKSAAITITGGTIDRPTATSLDYIHTTAYNLSKDRDFEFTINSITGPNLFLSLCDINTQGNVSVGAFETACNEVVSVVFSTTGTSLAIRYKEFGGVISSITYLQQTTLTANDVIKISVRNSFIKLFLNNQPLTDGTTYFNELNFRLTQNYYIRFSDASNISSSFNITLQDAPTPDLTGTDRDTIYEILYNPLSCITVPNPQRIGQRFNFINIQNEQQYNGFKGTDLNNTVRAIVSVPPYTILGGQFTTANGATHNRAVRFNHRTLAYEAFGTGFNDQIRALHVDRDGNLWLGGNFTQYNGVNYEAIISYDLTTNTFSQPANQGISHSTLTAEVNVIKSYQNKVYMGGVFETANNKTAINIVEYDIDSGTFAELPNDTTNGINGEIRTLEILLDGGYIWMGGTFTGAGTITANNFIQYEVKTNLWENVGNLDGDVYAIEKYDEFTLVVAGNFQNETKNGIPLNYIAFYNVIEREWTEIPNTFNNRIEKVLVLPTGAIVIAGLQTVEQFDIWIKGEWFQIGTGFNNITTALNYNNFLKTIEIGGNFTASADGKFSLGRLCKIPVATKVLYNGAVNKEVKIGEDFQIIARNLNYWF